MRWGEIIAWLSKNHRSNANAAQTKPPPSVAVYERGRACALVICSQCTKGGGSMSLSKAPLEWLQDPRDENDDFHIYHSQHSSHSAYRSNFLWTDPKRIELYNITWHNNHMARMTLILHQITEFRTLQYPPLNETHLRTDARNSFTQSTHLLTFQFSAYATMPSGYK